jgi:iron complex transport system permease protein
VLLLVGAVALGLAVGPTSVSVSHIVSDAASRFGIGHYRLSSVDSLIVWQLRAPRLVLGLLAGATLAVAGGTYQGVFRNPLADPYLLGAAAGAGLGATVAIAGAAATPAAAPVLAFVGALGAVGVTYAIGGRARNGAATLVLAGVAVSSLLTSIQTLLQQSSSDTVARVYIWLLGSLGTASWSSVRLVLPYVVICLTAALLSARALDVLSVGDDESRTLGLPVGTVRALVVLTSSLGTAAIVSVAGLIGFVGIVVPHIVRLVVGTSYRRILPLSVLVGASFLVFADTIARTVLAPSELPLGVVTALAGAPVFVALLAWRQGQP